MSNASSGGTSVAAWTEAGLDDSQCVHRRDRWTLTRGAGEPHHLDPTIRPFDPALERPGRTWKVGKRFAIVRIVEALTIELRACDGSVSRGERLPVSRWTCRARFRFSAGERQREPVQRMPALDQDPLHRPQRGHIIEARSATDGLVHPGRDELESRPVDRSRSREERQSSDRLVGNRQDCEAGNRRWVGLGEAHEGFGCPGIRRLPAPPLDVVTHVGHPIGLDRRRTDIAMQVDEGIEVVSNPVEQGVDVRCRLRPRQPREDVAGRQRSGPRW